jgi:hypothetical protein
MTMLKPCKIRSVHITVKTSHHLLPRITATMLQNRAAHWTRSHTTRHQPFGSLGTNLSQTATAMYEQVKKSKEKKPQLFMRNPSGLTKEILVRDVVSWRKIAISLIERGFGGPLSCQ